MTAGSAGALVGGDEGEATLVLILLPTVLAAILLVFQVGLLHHGRSVVNAAAADALRAAQVEGGDEQAGMDAANTTLSLAGGLIGATVDVDRGSAQVVVTVDADVSGPLPFTTAVTATAVGPVERWYSEGER